MADSVTPTSATRLAIDGDIATLKSDRPDKRNAMNDALVAELDTFFCCAPEAVEGRHPDR